ncbi:MAG: VWA domain-containing protein [Trueperaceae bacterium]|nr:VWA domain-containing protein [Trueperaceae bacterium]
MLDVSLDLHRDFLRADQAGQKLFARLTLRPDAQARQARPPLAIAFLIDTSGSMRDVVAPRTDAEQDVRAQNRLDIVIGALRKTLDAAGLTADDRLAVIRFDDDAEVLAPLTTHTRRARLIAASERLSRYAGGTQLGRGLEHALHLLQNETASRRIILLSDGQAEDEPRVRDLSQQLAAQHIPVTTIGVGDFNADLLNDLADTTQGRLIDVVADIPAPGSGSVNIHDLPNAIIGDVNHAQHEVITNAALSARTVKGVSLERVTRVFPVLTDVTMTQQPYTLGNIATTKQSVFILEFSLPARPAARIRLAQLGLTYDVPGANHRGELPPVDLVAEFTHDDTATARIDQQVMSDVQQRNVEQLVKQGIALARRGQADDAAKTIALARAQTQRLGNSAMTQALSRVLDELETSQTLSVGTAKTLSMSTKTQTMRVGDEALSQGLTEEELRRRTGA